MRYHAWVTCCTTWEYQQEIKDWLWGKANSIPHGFSYFHADAAFDAEDYLIGDLLVTLVDPTHIRFELEHSGHAVEVEFCPGDWEPYVASIVLDGDTYPISKSGKTILEALRRLSEWARGSADPKGLNRTMFVAA